jgi:iron(III) transport system permease protein
VLAFLWLPALQIYGGTLWQVTLRQPARWAEALPLQRLPRHLFINTAALSILTALLAIVCGLPVGLALARGPRWFRLPGFILCALPLAIPPMLGATAYLVLSGTPPARSLASLAATQPLTLNPILVTAPILALCFFPVVAFPVFAARRMLPSEYAEAARLSGTAWQTWRFVLWPLLSPVVLGAAGVVAALAMWEMSAPDLIDVRTYSVQIYRDFSAYNDVTRASLDAVPMLALGILMLLPAALALQRYGRSWHGAGDALLTDGRASTSSFCGGEPAIVIWSVLVFLASPLAVVAIFARMLPAWTEIKDAWGDNLPELINTLLLPTVAAVLIVAVCVMLAASWRAWPERLHKTALALCVTPLLCTPIMLAIALIDFYNRPQFAFIYGGLPESGNFIVDWLSYYSARYSMTLIGYGARFLPLAVLLMDMAMRRIDGTFLEAAQNLGANPWRVRRTILAPLTRLAQLGTFGLVWALCAAELPTTILVNAPGGQTLPVPIFNWMHVGMKPLVATLSLTLFGMSALVLGTAAALLRLGRRR